MCALIGAKLCDQGSDAVLDTCFARDPQFKFAGENKHHPYKVCDQGFDAVLDIHTRSICVVSAQFNVTCLMFICFCFISSSADFGTEAEANPQNGAEVETCCSI